MARLLICVLFALSLVVAIGCGRDEELPPQDPSSIAATATRQQFGEFSFEVPGGWSQASPDRSKTKALILLGGTNWTNSKGMIKVDVGSPAFPTAQETANNVAQSLGGQVLPKAVDVDGVSGAKVTSSSTGLSQPREIIVVYRNGKAYLLMAAAVDGVDVSNPLEHVRSTWKW